MSRQRSPAVLLGIVLFTAFLVVAHAYLYFGGQLAPPLKPMNAGELIQLLTGAVTAAALATISIQIEQSRVQIEQSRVQVEQSKQQDRVDAARRAAELQAAYYSPEMVRARVNADICLHDLSHDPKAVSEMVRYWVDSDFGAPVRARGPAARAHGRTPEELSEALTMMVGFFVRVHHHIETHRDLLTDAQRLEVMRLLGWPSWRSHGLVSFAKCCGEYPERAFKVGTYFIGILDKLDKDYRELFLAEKNLGAEDRSEREKALAQTRKLSFPP